MALIKKNSEVPSYALIFIAELINSTLHELHAKTCIFVKAGFLLYIIAPTFAIYFKFIYHETDNKSNKKRPLFMVFGELFNSKKRLTRADLGGGCGGSAPPPEMTCGFLIRSYTNLLYRLICIFSRSHYVVA